MFSLPMAYSRLCAVTMKWPERSSIKSPRSVRRSSVVSSSSRVPPFAPSSLTNCLNVARACGKWEMWSMSARSVIDRFYVQRRRPRFRQIIEGRRVEVLMAIGLSRWLWLLVPAVLCAAPARWARVGDFDGLVEVQLSPADQWIPAERNLPLPQSAWIRTGAASRVEIELDEGSVWRLGPESQGGLADYAQHSTGQRVTLLTLDHGLAYFSGSSSGQDSLVLVVPGAQVAVTKPARLRFEAADSATQLAVLQGIARFSSPAAEIDVAQGQTSRVEPAPPGRFFLYRDVAPIDLDRWSAAHDKTAATVSGLHVAQRYGFADLDAAGQWVETEDLGTVWQPRAAEGWTPYRHGHWRWLDGLGYAWVSGESWGWLP